MRTVMQLSYSNHPSCFLVDVLQLQSTSDFDTIGEVKGAYHKFTGIHRDLPRLIDVWTNLSEILWDTWDALLLNPNYASWSTNFRPRLFFPTFVQINLDGALPLEAKICPQVSLCFGGCVTTTGGTWSDGATIWADFFPKEVIFQGEILHSDKLGHHHKPDLWLTGWCWVRKECNTIFPAFQRGQKKQESVM